jgi:DNA-binding protein HU-beta
LGREVEMNKAQLIDAVSKATGLSKSGATVAVQTVFSSIVKALAQGKKVTVTGFGTWDTSKRPARVGVNPRHPDQKIQIPPVTVARFRAGKSLKEAVR